MHVNLFSFREFHNWQPDFVANKLKITIDEYKDLESGLFIVDAETALKLSALYQAPSSIFLATNSPSNLSVFYTHCNFHNSNGYVNHHYQNQDMNAKEGQVIELLKEELKQLKRQNEDLVKQLINLTR